MVPTVLDLLGVEPPVQLAGVSQSPIEGASFADALRDSAAPGARSTQYFEMLGHRSIYHDGRRAVCPWPGTSFIESGRPFGEPITAEILTELDANGWELYHVDEGFAENHDVVAEHPEKLIELIAQWYVEAGKYNVLPVDGRGQQRCAEERPVIAKDRSRYVYFPGTSEIAPSAAPGLLNRPHTITALVEIPDEGAEGVFVSQGGIDRGSGPTSGHRSPRPTRHRSSSPDGSTGSCTTSPASTSSTTRPRSAPHWHASDPTRPAVDVM